jgi:hypothetical protein
MLEPTPKMGLPNGAPFLLTIEDLWRSLRSANLISIKAQFPAAWSDKLSFALHLP